jgi:hypothetical protein
MYDPTTVDAEPLMMGETKKVAEACSALAIIWLLSQLALPLAKLPVWDPALLLASDGALVRTPAWPLPLILLSFLPASLTLACKRSKNGSSDAAEATLVLPLLLLLALLSE